MTSSTVPQVASHPKRQIVGYVRWDSTKRVGIYIPQADGKGQGKREIMDEAMLRQKAGKDADVIMGTLANTWVTWGTKA